MIDHLVYATPDLDATVAALAADWGVSPTQGGRHTGRGTRNALLDLGDGAYLEVIGPDLDQPPPAQPRAFGIDDLAVARLATWAVKAPGIDARVEAARSAGYDPGVVFAMSRATPGGDVLHWKLTRRDDMPGEGLVPFLIDWGDAVHPSATSARGCRLISLTAEHPEPAVLRRWLEALDVELRVDEGPHARLIALIATPRGARELS